MPDQPPPHVPVVTCPGHIGHRPSVEVQCGVQVPAYDVVERMSSILAALESIPEVRLRAPRPFGEEPIRRVHEADVLRTLGLVERQLRMQERSGELVFGDTFLHAELRAHVGTVPPVGSNLGALLGRLCFDTITGFGAGTASAAVSAVDTALSAAEQLLAGPARLVLALCRPPGHHAGARLMGGGTFLNNAAVAAQWLRDQGIGRIAVLDIDFHHGNGTQAIFYDRDDVVYVSVHGHPSRSFPYFTGWPDETGSGRGRGWNHNIPLPEGADGDVYRDRLTDALAVVDRCRPEALVLSLGFDTYVSDVAGDARLTTGDYRSVGADIARLAVPTLAVLEGGYAVDDLGANLVSWLAGHQAW
ncbi:MAG TPA: histone deacetylase family protein [Actinophytocola sp.]|uniref:histone deacetylase family protein n=1 Tax=Actinophytocola sp. TaxID=1872138 RepID=UPI002DDD2CE8|nr:histone deacetylase family protein [Actinophytocola sp.]HEV2778603.1 histone deacetylase family protein [Actinophytocola sp.]